MTILPAWRHILRRSYALRVQFFQALFGALTFLDPGAMLAVWNLMPESVARRVPPAFVSWIGAVLFALALLTILLRLFQKPKLQEETNGLG